MLSPAMRPARKRATFTNCNEKARPLGGIPNQSPLLVPRNVPPRHGNVIAEGEALVVRRQVRKCSEIPLISLSSCGATLAAHIERHRLEITVIHANVAMIASKSRAASAFRCCLNRLRDGAS